VAVVVDGDAADARFGEREAEAEFFFHCGENAPRFGHYFGADSVAG
jgi:hypothetical protein